MNTLDRFKQQLAAYEQLLAVHIEEYRKASEKVEHDYQLIIGGRLRTIKELKRLIDQEHSIGH